MERALHFSGKEKDEETGYGYFGARYYDSDLSIWLSVDPLADKYPSLSPYVYCANNPIKLVDPDGEEVEMIYYKNENKIHLTDLDHYEKGLPTLYVSHEDYKQGGIRDENGKLTHNQTLVVEGVFTGGTMDPEGNFTRNENNANHLPIPNGAFDLTEYEGNSSWYKVDPIDSKRYDDHHQGQTNASGETRNGYRFHQGTVSHGCITVNNSGGDRTGEWGVIQSIINNTSTTQVPKREGMQKFNPFSGTRTRYGTVFVK